LIDRAVQGIDGAVAEAERLLDQVQGAVEAEP